MDPPRRTYGKSKSYGSARSQHHTQIRNLWAEEEAALVARKKELAEEEERRRREAEEEEGRRRREKRERKRGKEEGRRRRREGEGGGVGSGDGGDGGEVVKRDVVQEEKKVEKAERVVVTGNHMRWVESDDEVEEEEEEGKVEEKEKEREKSRRESFAEIEGIKHTSERVNVELEALGGGGGGVGVLLHGVQHALELESTNEGINRRISRSREVVYGFNSITNNTITTTTKTTTLPSKPQFIDRNLLLSPDHEPVISSPDRRGGLRRKSSKLTQGSARTRSVSPVVSALRLTPSALSPGGHIKLQGEVDLFGEKVGAGLLGAVAEAEKEVEGEVEREREIVVPEVIVDSVDDESKVVEAEEEEQYYEEAELEVTEIAEEDLSRLLGLCTESRTVPFEEHISTLLETSTLRKLGEASYSEVYICEPHPPTPTTTGTSTSTPLLPPKTVLKIIPFGKPSQCPISQILGELLITRTMSPVPGFVGFHSAHVCVGAFPQHLLDLWDYWDEEIKESENDRPDFYESDQLFAVIGLEDGGRDLESFELEGWAEARTVFWDTAVALARGECRREFEHRDMHFGNIVIKRVEVEAVGDGSEEEEEQGGGGVEGMLQALTLDSSSKTKAKSKNKKSAGGKKQQPQQEKSTRLKVTLIDYTLSRAMCEDGSLMFTPLDDEALFEGKGDYQFDVYRFMRTLFLAHHPDNTSAPLTPQTDPNDTPINPLTGLPDDAPPPPPPPTYTSPEDLDPATIPWHLFLPKSNVFWLHYLLNILLSKKRELRKPSSRSKPSADVDAYRELEWLFKGMDTRKKRFARGGGGGGGVEEDAAAIPEFSSAAEFVEWARGVEGAGEGIVDAVDLEGEV